MSGGASRIPLPPCLQRRPKQLQATDAHLLRFVRGQSRLPAAPGSNGSSVTSSIGGMVRSSSGSSLSSLQTTSAANTGGGAADSTGQQYAGRAVLSSGTSTQASCHTRGPSTPSECTSSAVLSAGQPQADPTAGSSSALPIGSSTSRPSSYPIEAAVVSPESDGSQRPSGGTSPPAVLTPVNRLESQPGLVAVAAAAAALGYDAEVSSLGGSLASEAAKVEDLKKLWEAISQAGAVVRMSDEDGLQQVVSVESDGCRNTAGECVNKV